MPLTPFHFGPGTFVKSLAPRWFSLRAFMASQIVIDCETAWNMARGNTALHTFFHTYLGVSVAMMLAGLFIFTYNQFALRFSNSWLVRDLDEAGRPFEFRSSSIAILIGGWSHVFLDSIMHSDLQPLSPFSKTNAMLAVVPLKTLHMACLWSFAGAAIFWQIRKIWKSRKSTQFP